MQYVNSTIYCLDLKESDDAKIHFARNKEGKIIQPIYGYWKGSNEGSNYHSACTQTKGEVSDEEYLFLLDQTDIFYFADIDVHKHEWGKEFSLKGVPSKACKICKEIVPVE